nr:immunoglobulin heavy chain junction region [Macaca mulatta]MOX61130.1 immunoglobulin heavy chain junction region [Macaca mulatta]MOX62298.1 immunoglobulin heavy chain junction region [Macaca mulatta]MOX62542.1 immunoglobulin heavy chain junction region [Macaca mulatta]MOX62716.1 immunoglobulin heavy chain junction region [Macaca mulatta]
CARLWGDYYALQYYFDYW